MRPTFSGFGLAKQGLDAARANLQVTGQNMTNSESIGYTRQRVDTYARGVGSRSSKYATSPDGYIGEGVVIAGVRQMRDPYLDNRYRREHPQAGEAVAQLDALKDLETVFGKITDEGFANAFSGLLTQLRELAKTPTDPVAGKLVKTQATILTQIFNETAHRIKTIKSDQLEGLKEGSITDINDALSEIANLNKEIKSAEVSGNPALELRDSRNVLLDQLSQYMNIEVVTTPVDIGGGNKVEELSVNLLGRNGEKFMLVDGKEHRQLALGTDAAGEVTHPVKIILQDSKGSFVSLSNDDTVDLDMGDITGQLTTGLLKGTLKMINDAGEFDTPPTKSRGIQFYEKMLDSVANQFATAMNKANSTDNHPEGLLDKPLFEVRDPADPANPGPITAANISISKAWDMSNDNYITASKKPVEADSKQNDNILYMISLFSEKMQYSVDGSNYPLFNGSFQECVSHIVTTCGAEVKNVERQANSFLTTLNAVESDRQSVSAVNVDEEGINLIMYNQALTAASRFMTTLDEALETIISRMGVVGR